MPPERPPRPLPVPDPVEARRLAVNAIQRIQRAIGITPKPARLPPKPKA